MDEQAGNRCIIPIESDGINRRGKRLKDATLLNLLQEIFRRFWFCIRRCGRRILSFFGKVRRIDRHELQQNEENEPFLEPREPEITKLNAEINELHTRLQEKENDLYHFRVSEERYFQDRNNMQREIENLHFKLKKAENDIENLRKAKDEALSRLSEMMGRRLRENNPAITDLNDPNRPMKLGEQFSELYENEWTDAFVDLQSSKGDKGYTLSDEEVIKILLDILMEINEESNTEYNLQLSGIFKSVQGIPKDEASDFTKPLVDALRANANNYLPLIYKKISADGSPCQTVKTYFTECQQYVKSCVKVCYFATIQDPPMYLHFDVGKSGDEYDKQVFREYTATGIRVHFLVWPALYLHKGGALLSKGVVQPIQETFSQKEYTKQTETNENDNLNAEESNQNLIMDNESKNK